MPIRQLRRDACRALAGSSHADGPDALRQHLVGLFASGSLSAQALTKLAWFITRGGGSGVADLARDPDSIGRNAARHLKERLGMNDIADNFLLYVAVPQHHGRGKLATRRPLPILPTRNYRENVPQPQARVYGARGCTRPLVRQFLFPRHGACSRRWQVLPAAVVHGLGQT